MLEILGVGPVEERLYRELLRHPQWSLTDLAAATGISAGQARRAAAGLIRAGLVSRRQGSPARLVPAPPDVAVEALIARRTEEFGRARLSAAGLLDEYRQGARRNSAAELVEVITGRDAIYQRSVQLLHSARKEILMFDKPPYIGPPDNAIQYELLTRGIRWRSVYAAEALHTPDRLAELRSLTRAGERARIAPDLPLKLAIADNRLALLPLTTDEHEQELAILVHPSSLLTTLVTLFDLFWDRALPASSDPEMSNATTQLRSADRTLVLLLISGATDETIARQLGVSPRTAHRRLAELMHTNGVQTRFQLGYIAGKQGWA